ncbi:MAG: HAMP domain-containing protein, partial [Acetobacteraceae bacterium]|nr:HAMP domain-containing protein [Acetobacteraceae bacterium]
MAGLSRTLSLRALMLGAVLALGALGASGFAWHAAEDSRALLRAMRARDANLAANRLAEGLSQMLLERLATGAALQAPAPAGRDTLDEIARRRAAMRAAVGPGLAALAEQDFPGRQERLDALHRALAELDALRAEADAALRQPLAARDAALRRDFIPRLTAHLNTALEAWLAAVHGVAAGDPVLARLAVMQEIGWRIRDTAGQERSAIASAMSAGERVAPERQALNASIRARVDLLWAQLGQLAPRADPTLSPMLRAALAAAEREYFGGFRAIADQMTRGGPPYPMDVARFAAVTTPQLDTLLEILKAAGAAGEERAAALVAQARWATILAIGFLLACLAIVGAAVLLVVRRMSRPLTALAAATSRLAEGDLDAEPPGTARGDEVGSVARALVAL